MILSRPLELMVVEDNPGDVDLVRSALRKGTIATNLTVAPDGAEALAMLRQRLTMPPLPDIILLDLNLPKKSGHDVLKEIKGDPVLKMIPVIVLTSSAAPEDVATAYDLGSNCYLTKSLDISESKRTMKVLEDFWFQTALLPAVG